jgi:triosephosphate isomerase (TIM)
MKALVVGNWKMHDTVVQALQLVDGLLAVAGQFPDEVDVAVAPPFTSLQAVSERLLGRPRRSLGAQTWNHAHHCGR